MPDSSTDRFKGRPPFVFCFKQGLLDVLKMNKRESTRLSYLMWNHAESLTLGEHQSSESALPSGNLKSERPWGTLSGWGLRFVRDLRLHGTWAGPQSAGLSGKVLPLRRQGRWLRAVRTII
jgi:hypothetical protein